MQFYEMDQRQSESSQYRRIILPLLILTFLLFMAIYSFRLLFNASVSNVTEAGEDRISNIAAQLTNYMDTTMSELWATALSWIITGCSSGIRTKRDGAVI